MNTNNIVFYFETLSEGKSDEWALLFKNLSGIFDNIYCVIPEKNIHPDSFSEYATVISEPKGISIFKSDWTDNYKKLSGDYYNISNLVDHPGLIQENRVLKFLPNRMQFKIKESIISNKIFFFEKLVRDFEISHLMVMEPKDFLYSPSVILLEALSNKHNVVFNFIHGSFFINNIKIYDNLNRFDKKIIHEYNTVKISDINSKKTLDFMEKYRDYLYGNLYLNRITKNKFSDNCKKYSNESNKPYILWLASKPNNYRSFYVNPTWTDAIIIKMLKYIPTGYDLVVKLHPHVNKKSIRKSNWIIVDYTYDNFDLLNNASLIITGVSHSFVDALILYKNVAIIGDYNYLFSYNEGPFHKISNIDQFGRNIMNIINNSVCTNDVIKLFHSVLNSNNDPYFTFDRTLNRYKNKGYLFSPHKANQMIYKYYSDLISLRP